MDLTSLWLSKSNVQSALGVIIMDKVKEDAIRSIAILFDVLIAVPLLTLANLYLYILRARLILGYWPAPGHPPYLVVPHFQAVLVPIGSVASFVCLIMAVAVVLWLLLGKHLSVLESPPVVKRVLLFFAVWAILFVLFRLDPGQFIAWIWD